MSLTADLALVLARAVAPLERALASGAAMAALLGDLGWLVGTPPPAADTGHHEHEADDHALPPPRDYVLGDEQQAAAVAAFGVAGALRTLLTVAERLGRGEDVGPQTMDAAKALFVLLGTLDGNDSSTAPFDDPQLWAQLRQELPDYLLVRYLRDHEPAWLATLTLLGLVESTLVVQSGGRIPYQRRRLRWDLLDDLVTDPLGHLAGTYDWGSAQLDHQRLLPALAGLFRAYGSFARLHLPSEALRSRYYGGTTPGPVPRELAVPLLFEQIGEDFADFAEIGFTAYPIPESPGGPPRGLLLAPHVRGEFTEADPTDEDDDQDDGGDGAPVLEVAGGFDTDGAVGIEILPSGVRPRLEPGAVAVGSTLAVAARPDRPMVLFGSRDGTRLEIDGVRAALQTRGHADDLEFVIEVGTDVPGQPSRIRFVVRLDQADGFLAAVLGTGTRTIEFAGTLSWSSKHGLSFRGGGLEVSVPLNAALGPVRLSELRAGLAGRPGGGAAATVAVSGDLRLGPVRLTVTRVGAAVTLAPAAAGQAGTFAGLDIGVAFKAPDGLGVSVDAGPVRGGGFIRYDGPAGRYFGALDLRLERIGLTGFGVLDTRLPGGAQGYSFLAVLSGRFPPIAIGWGFTLTGVGGLLGINRRVDVDALRQRIATGAAGRLLAPENPAGNAVAICADLGALFPAAAGTHVVGPTVKLSWLGLVRFDLGLFFVLPGPSHVVLLGTAHTRLGGTEAEPALRLRLDIAGVLDTARRSIEFDAVLIDSKLLGVFDLTGGAAFRLSWGDRPYVALAIGGFHPSFNPEPMVVPPSLTRVAMTRGSRSDTFYLRLAGYFAITGNTLQLGAAAEVVLRAGSLTAEGFFDFDVLIRLSPFAFVADFRAGLRVRYHGRSFAGVRVRGTLSGPGPVKFSGSLSIDILFFSISWRGSFSLGQPAPPAVRSVASALDELADALRDARNLRADGSEDPMVVLSPAPAGRPLVPGRGRLVWAQRRAPLGLVLHRFEGAQLPGPQTVTLAGPQLNGDERDDFAPGTFTDLTDAEALNRPAFDRLVAGGRFGTDAAAGPAAQTVSVRVRQFRLPEPVPKLLDGTALAAWVLAGAGHRADRDYRRDAEPRVTVTGQRWQVRRGGALRRDKLSAAEAHAHADVEPGAVAVAATDVLPAPAW